MSAANGRLNLYAREPAREILPERRKPLRNLGAAMASVVVGENLKFTMTTVVMLLGLAASGAYQASKIGVLADRRAEDVASNEKRFDKLDAAIGAQGARIDALIANVVPRSQVEDVARSIAREELLRASR